ncbi:MAG: hypothetical protein PHG66_03515 [Candidatus Colwellbacteria bacterium]|nr:hypothetical protein [Candidatus Colwellbacteria bacterium]
MINPSIYRAYDIRGKYPAEIDEDVVRHIVSSLNVRFFKKGPIVIAHDARNSSPALYKAVIEALRGREIMKVGPSTSPMFYFSVAANKAAGGVMVTASHSPSEWNGLKIVGPKAVPLNGFDTKKIIEENEG